MPPSVENVTGKESKRLGNLSTDAKASIRLILLVALILLPFGLYLALERGQVGWTVVCFVLICAAMAAVAWRE
jgi:hypothetical protein